MTKPSPQQQTVDYYQTFESRVGYKMVLGGAKHFGYYPPGVKHLSMRSALRIMEDEIGRAVGLEPGAKILDAGSGMGRVATYLAKNFGYQVEGIDLLDFNVAEAKRFAAKHGVSDAARFQIGDYGHLPYPDNSFDAVYTIETFVHAPDFRAVYAEFKRVLKPGGRLVQHEYTLSPPAQMTAAERESFRSVTEASAMHALPEFTHGSFPGHLSAAGFENPRVIDLTDRIEPMVRRFHHLAWLPYHLRRLTAADPKRYVNVQASVEWYRHYKHFRYVEITASKPG